MVDNDNMQLDSSMKLMRKLQAEVGMLRKENARLLAIVAAADALISTMHIDSVEAHDALLVYADALSRLNGEGG